MYTFMTDILDEKQYVCRRRESHDYKQGSYMKIQYLNKLYTKDYDNVVSLQSRTYKQT